VRVLIVDNDPEVRDAIREMLEARGHVAAVAGNASEAVLSVGDFRPDLALVDIRLGPESGFDVVRALTRAQPSLAVLLMSVSDAVASADDVRDSGARGFVRKQRLVSADLAALCR
jgi:DNA-binding response OmpR family regulator